MSLTTPVRLRVMPALLPVNGREIELRVSEGIIQQRYGPHEPWRDIANRADLKGDIGPKTDLRFNGSYIQYRPEGDGVWSDLVLVDDLVSPYISALQGNLAISVEDAQRARDLAQGFASDLVSQGSVPIYATVAGMAALSVPEGINLIRVNGQDSPNDGKGGHYSRLSESASGVGVFSTADGSSWRYVAGLDEVDLDKLDPPSVDPGQTPQDCSPHIQTAINMLPRGGVVWVSQKVYGLATTLVANQGVILCAKGPRHGCSDSTVNTNGSARSLPRMHWLGAADGYMYIVKPDNIGDIVFGGGTSGIEWDGATVAACGVWLDNTAFGLLAGSARNMRFAGAIIDATSGSPVTFSLKNSVPNWWYTWGHDINGPCINSNGLMLRGNGSTVPATQQLLGAIFGLVYNGSVLTISETDNVQCAALHGVVQGNGYAAYLYQFGFQPANMTIFQYVVGRVFLEAGTMGTSFDTYVSEGGGISGGGQWHASNMVDYITGRSYVSRKYALRSRKSIGAGEFAHQSTFADLAFQWKGIALPHDVETRVTAIVPLSEGWANGGLAKLRLLVGRNSSAAGNILVGAVVSTVAVGPTGTGPIVTPEVIVGTPTPAAPQFELQSIEYQLNLSYALGDTILLRVQRRGDLASDTLDSEVILMGATIEFVGNGPDSPGSGSYQIPVWN